MSMLYASFENSIKRILCLSFVSSLSLFSAGCADVNVPDARNVNIPTPVTAEERRQAVNERPDSVMYLPLGEDILVPSVLSGGGLPDDKVGPFELRGETLAGALQLILADYDISIAFETDEGLSRKVTVANLRGDLNKVVSRVCSLADLYCSFEDGVVVVKDAQVFVVTMPPIGEDGDTAFIDDVITGLTAIVGDGVDAPVSDPTTRSIIYTATQRGAKLAENYFQRLRASTALIVFETYIWEVSLDAGHSAGINWDDFATFGKYNVGATVTGSVAADFTNPVAIGLPTTGFLGTDTAPTEVFNFLSTFGAVKTISQPQISVLSGSTAELRVADTQNYVSEITTTLSQGGQSSTSVSTDSVDTGFTLNISSSWDKSTVYADVGINLENVNRIDDFTFSDSGAGGTDTIIQLPQTSERELNTQVRTRPGDSILIGGLVRESDNFDTRGPGLMEPVLPDSRTAKTQNLELVIMMRPRVVVYTSGEDQRYQHYLDTKNAKAPSIENSARTDWLKSNSGRQYTTTRQAPVKSPSVEPSLSKNSVESAPLVSKKTYNPEMKPDPISVTPQVEKNSNKPVAVVPEIKSDDVKVEQVIEPRIDSDPVAEPVAVSTPDIFAEDVTTDVVPTPDEVVEDVVEPTVERSVDIAVPEAEVDMITPPRMIESADPIDASEYYDSTIGGVDEPKGRVSKAINDFSNDYVPSQSSVRVSKGSGNE